jgi:hypothetical protein
MVFTRWGGERAGVEPAREVIRRIYSPMLSTDQPSFRNYGAATGNRTQRCRVTVDYFTDKL